MSQASSDSDLVASRSTQRRPRRAQVFAAARVLSVLLLMLGLVWSFRSQYSVVRAELARVAPWTLLCAVLLSAAGVGASMLAWRALLADLGSPLPLRAGIRVYSFSQLGKYVPGSIWPVLAQMELGRAYGVPRARAATAFLLSIVVSVTSATAMGGLLALSLPSWGHLTALLPLLLLLLHPTLLRPLTSLAARMMRRAGVVEPPTLSGVLRAVAWMVALWFLLGAASAVIVHGLGADVSLLRIVAAVALAWAAGLIVIVAPAGAGVRESVLVLLLADQMGAGGAITLALLSRLAITAADGFWVLIAITARRKSDPARIATVAAASTSAIEPERLDRAG